jgi:hypothetical protein
MERNVDTMFGVSDDVLGRLGLANEGTRDRLDAEQKEGLKPCIRED